MANHISAFGWTLDLALGWKAEVREETLSGETTTFLAITPASNDAVLRLTPDERGMMPATEWVEAVGQINRDKGRAVESVRCGDFAGNTVRIAAGNERIRGWALCSGSTPLDACYRCQAIDVGRDDAVVDKMLSTLRIDATDALP